jgi:hypothetical protein
MYQPVRSRLSEHVGLAGNIFTSSILKYAILSEFIPIFDVQTCLQTVSLSQQWIDLQVTKKIKLVCGLRSKH